MLLPCLNVYRRAVTPKAGVVRRLVRRRRQGAAHDRKAPEDHHGRDTASTSPRAHGDGALAAHRAATSLAAERARFRTMLAGSSAPPPPSQAGQGRAQTGACAQRLPRLSVAAEDVRSLVMSWLLQRHRAPERWEYKVDAAESEARQRELDANIARAAEGIAPLAEQVEAERARVQELEALLGERHRLLAELTRFSREIREAHTQLRRAERALERERARAGEPDVQGERQRRGRTVKLLVDPDAFEAFRTDARSRYLWTGWALRDLILAELDATDLQDLPETRRRRSPGEGDPVPAQRSLRVFIEEDRWPEFVTLSRRSGLTVGRYLGQLVEAAAHELGWRASA